MALFLDDTENKEIVDIVFKASVSDKEFYKVAEEIKGLYQSLENELKRIYKQQAGLYEKTILSSQSEIKSLKKKIEALSENHKLLKNIREITKSVAEDNKLYDKQVKLLQQITDKQTLLDKHLNSNAKTSKAVAARVSTSLDKLKAKYLELGKTIFESQNGAIDKSKKTVIKWAEEQKKLIKDVSKAQKQGSLEYQKTVKEQTEEKAKALKKYEQLIKQEIRVVDSTINTQMTALKKVESAKAKLEVRGGSSTAIEALQKEADARKKSIDKQVAYLKHLEHEQQRVLKGEKEVTTEIVENAKVQATTRARSVKTQIRELNKLTLANEKAYASASTLRDAEGSSFWHKIKTTSQYAAAGTAFYAVASAVHNAVDAIKEFNKASATMSAVFRISGAEANQLTRQLEDLGTALGGNQKEIYDIAFALGRANVATKDLKDATEVVIKMAYLTGDSFDDATEAIIAYSENFGEATKAGLSIKELGDKLAYVANVSRLSTHDIGIFSNYAL